MEVGIKKSGVGRPEGWRKEGKLDTSKTVRFNSEDLKRLESLAQKEGVDVGKLIRRVVLEWLNNETEQKEQVSTLDILNEIRSLKAIIETCKVESITPTLQSSNPTKEKPYKARQDIPSEWDRDIVDFLNNAESIDKEPAPIFSSKNPEVEESLKVDITYLASLGEEKKSAGLKFLEANNLLGLLVKSGVVLSGSTLQSFKNEVLKKVSVEEKEVKNLDTDYDLSKLASDYGLPLTQEVDLSFYIKEEEEVEFLS